MSSTLLARRAGFLDGRVPTSTNVLNPDVVGRFLERFGTKVAGR